MIERILIISLIINGIDLVTSEGYAFHWIRRLSKKTLHPLLYDPIVGCIVCMASFWGTLLYWGWFHVKPFDDALIWFIPSLLMIAVLNPIISKLIDGKG